MKAAGRHHRAHAQIPGRRQIDGHALAMEGRADDARAGLERGSVLCASDALHEPREAARAIAAHVRHRAVTVVKLPGPIGLARSIWNEEEQPIRTDTALTIAQAHDLFGGELDFDGAIIDQNEVIPGTVHLYEFQIHGAAP